MTKDTAGRIHAGNDPTIAALRTLLGKLEQTEYADRNREFVREIKENTELLFEEVRFQYDMMCHLTEVVSMYATHCKKARPLPSKALMDRALNVLDVMQQYAEGFKK